MCAKMKKMVMMVLVVALLSMMLVACSSGNDTPEPTPQPVETETPSEQEITNEEVSLAGLWKRYDEKMLILFRDDGSGTYVMLRAEERNYYGLFEWSTEDGVLTIHFEDGELEVVEYKIDGGNLMVSDEFDEVSFTSLEIGSILGDWTDDTWYSYTFRADGTGASEALDIGWEVELEWSSNNNGILTVHFEGITGEIEYTLLGDIIMMRAVGDHRAYILERVG